MITVEVIVPVLNQNYDFRLDEAAKISSLLEEMLEMLCRKEKRHVPESFDSFSLGYVDGGIIDANGVEQLASIPSKEVLIAKFLGSIKSPVYKLAYALQAVADKNGEGEAPAEEASAQDTAETAADTAAAE